MSLRIVGILVLSLFGFGAVAAVSAEPPSDKKLEESDALEVLKDDASTEKIAKWLNEIANRPIADRQSRKIERYPESVEPLILPSAEVLELMALQRNILVELATLWTPFENDYLKASREEGSRMIVEFIRNNQPKLIQLMNEYSGIDIKISRVIENQTP